MGHLLSRLLSSIGPYLLALFYYFMDRGIRIHFVVIQYEVEPVDIWTWIYKDHYIARTEDVSRHNTQPMPQIPRQTLRRQLVKDK